MNTIGGWLPVVWISCGFLGGLVASQQLIGQPPAAPAPVPVLPGREWQSLAPIVKQIQPAVVLIEGQGRVRKPAGQDTEPGFGSGVIIDPNGVILTNHHVVVDFDTIEVTLHDGRKFTTRDIRRDPSTDIALLTIAANNLPVAEFANSDEMEVGDRVLAFGAPFGLTHSVTSGIVSAKNRKDLKLNAVEDFLQTDAAVNAGNSGGPLVNMAGKVVGLTSAIKTRTGGFQGVGLAVSSNLAKRTAEQLLKKGPAKRPFLGITIRDLDEAAARTAGYRGTTGIVVTHVIDASPAAKAGVQPGDVVTKINDRAIADAAEAARIIAALPVGEVAEVYLWRGGKYYVGKVKVEEERQAFRPIIEPLPPAPAPPVTSADVGLAMTDFTEEMAQQRRLPPGTTGATISGVARNSLAEKAGLVRGWVVLKVDKTPVTSALSFEQALRQADPAKGAILHVLKPQGEIEFVLLRLK
ncbi:MAG: trypsin-like peptidase domain-containing protein [Gemmataceae bacterium]|nr:trypsin-like peptidase domain-containing protein [Gemmata sp.]MDW8199215.1 trypsin-like peptidase domain-containing protein [Gemmataceae bacterium]